MKICIHTLGCKVNQYESDALKRMLEEKGHEVNSTTIDFADLYILNTCAVTNEAEKKSRQTIAKFKEKNANAKVIVLGCASQKDHKQFREIENTSFISGVAGKQKIIDYLESMETNIFDFPKDYEEDMIANSSSKTRVYLKIQDGCNNFCSYCIIPYLRGRSRSRNLQSILEEAKKASITAKEIVLTGIDISDYRIDGKLQLGTLLKELDKLNVRIRLGSLEVRLFNDEFLGALKDLKNLCPHFHLSLQSGCDTVLQRMNRKYTTDDYLSVVKKLRKIYPNAMITTDIIVGFPEETDEEFLKTYNFVKKVKFSQIHIFPYSKRSGTKAEKMTQINGKIKKERVKILNKLAKKIEIKYLKSQKHKKLNVLIEEKEEGYFVGHTENYVKIYLKGEYEPNTIYRVKPLKIFKDGMLGKEIK